MPFSHTEADYTIGSPLTVNVPVANSGNRFCLNLNTINDSLDENLEQFHFDLIDSNISPSGFAMVGDPDSLCVNITDNDSKLVDQSISIIIIMI